MGQFVLYNQRNVYVGKKFSADSDAGGFDFALEFGIGSDTERTAGVRLCSDLKCK